MIYRPLIEDMTWSFSRVESYDGCPFRWKLHYINGKRDEDTWYASYGKFMHEIIDSYYKGNIKKEDMLMYFLLNFKSNVLGRQPKNETVEKYLTSGTEYLRNFSEFPFEYVDSELKITFEIDGIPFIGIIDYLGKSNDGYVIVDNKSRELKPRSTRAKPTKKDEELDDMLKQLYLYSEGIKQVFGEYPKLLCFNCFRNQEFIIEEFRSEKLESAKKWAVDTINRIMEDNDFEPKENAFVCNWMCGVNRYCEAHQDTLEEWRNNRE